MTVFVDIFDDLFPDALEDFSEKSNPTPCALIQQLCGTYHVKSYNSKDVVEYLAQDGNIFIWYERVKDALEALRKAPFLHLYNYILKANDLKPDVFSLKVVYYVLQEMSSGCVVRVDDVYFLKWERTKCFVLETISDLSCDSDGATYNQVLEGVRAQALQEGYYRSISNQKITDTLEELSRSGYLKPKDGYCKFVLASGKEVGLQAEIEQRGYYVVWKELCFQASLGEGQHETWLENIYHQILTRKGVPRCFDGFSTFVTAYSVISKS